MNRIGLLLSLLILAALAGPARADQATDQARAHFKKGQIHYSLGEFAQAADEFREAYRWRNEPAILYNLAQAMRLLGRTRHAIFYYEQYLAKRADAANRIEVETIIASLREKLKREQAAPAAGGDAEAKNEDDAVPSLPATQTAASAPAAESDEAPAAASDEPARSSVPAAALAASTAPPESTSMRPTRLAGYGALGAGVLLEGGAFIFHGSAKSAADELNGKYAAGTLKASDAHLRSDIDSKGKLATITAVGGALALVAGAVLVFAF